ncbi:hypothetical protein ACERII_09635 [Evansella sp. AB-rgal1]|uniref:hypothetical protein n=1 Tax=Evansella sp. AB-rgal1 TaxID=3242696 RepID=UPI00359EC50E
MFNLNKINKEKKVEYVIVAIIFAISIIVGIAVGSNTEWFRPQFYSGGYMAGSLVTCLALFSIYQFVNFILSFVNKKKTAE